MNSTTGIGAAMATLLCWTIGTFAFAEASRNAEPLSVNRVRLLFATAALSLIVVALFQTEFLFASAEQWLWLGCSGII
ncbi:MAG: EamA family transporter, partial [Bacteroidota bacterium]